MESHHRPLLALFENKCIVIIALGRIQRWALYLPEFDYSFGYIKGNDKLADALSRLSYAEKRRCDKNQLDYIDFMENCIPINYEVVKFESKNDKVLSKIFRYIREGCPEIIEELRPFSIRRNEINFKRGTLMWEYRLLIPNILRIAVLREVHSTYLDHV